MQMTDRTPVAALRALLEKSLDYAGLFPPANLPLDTAVKNYATYLKGADAWFLGHFVCPVSQLAELNPYIPLFSKSAPLVISALALPSVTWKEFKVKLRESLSLIFRFQHSCAPRVRVDSIEIALPADLTDMVGVIEIRDLVPAAAEEIELSGLGEMTPFFEVTAKDWGRQAGATIDSIARHNGEWNGVHCQPAAFKLRTGGVKAEAFPTINQLAFVIGTCLAGLRFKCTAGLHHPIRHYDQSVATKMHGFLNLFGAAVLLHARSLDASNLPLVLEDEESSHFQFFEKGFAWWSDWASLEDIASARRDLIVSFGSCSFEEPLEDLRQLRLL